MEKVPIPRHVTRGATGFVTFFALVEVLVASGVIDVGSIPRPSEIFREVLSLLTDTVILGEVWVTVKGAAVGLAAAIVVGVLLGIIVSTSIIARRLLLPVIQLIRPLPGVAYAPLLIAVFQRGLMSRSFTVAVACTWPILFNSQAGFAAVDPIAVQTARSVDETKWAIVRRISLPSASPFIWTGIRISASIAIIVEVAVEILIPDGTGIGGFLAQAGSGGVDLATIYAATFVAGLLSIVMNMALDTIDTRVFNWRKGLGA